MQQRAVRNVDSSLLHITNSREHMGQNMPARYLLEQNFALCITMAYNLPVKKSAVLVGPSEVYHNHMTTCQAAHNTS